MLNKSTFLRVSKRTETKTTKSRMEMTKTRDDRVISHINLNFWQFYAGN